MNRRLLVSLIAVAAFALTSIVAADGKKLFSKPDESPTPASKSLAVNRHAMAINSRDYRSPGTLRKVIIDKNDTETLANAAADGATEIGDYGSFKLFAVNNDAVERDVKKHLDSPRNTVGASHRYTVRDDYNVL